MTSASIAELKNQLSRYLRRVRGGEVVLVTDRGRPIAWLEPVRDSSLETGDEARRVARLEASGVIKRGRGKLSQIDFSQRPKANAARAGLVEAVLEEREEGH